MRIKEKSIREHTGEQSLLLGRDYAQRRAIFDTKQQGLLLKARCEGSRPTPYQLWARLDPLGNVVDSGCNCPVSGRCKHVAALLLSWRAAPEEFLQLTPIPELLASRSREDLEALILQMLSRAPELEDLFEIPAPQSDAPSLQREIESNRRQINALSRRLQHHHEAIAQNLQTFLSAAQGLIDKESWRAAAAALLPIATEIISHHEEDLDDHPTLLEVVVLCVAALGKILPKTQDEELRGVIIRTFIDVYRFDIEVGGITVGDEIPGILLRHANPGESRWVAQRLREALPQTRDWGRRELGGLLLNLERERLDDESFLLLCRETNRPVEEVGRLLQLSREEEIPAAVQQANDEDALRAAELLVSQDKAQLAEESLDARERQQPSERVAAWLLARRTLLSDQPIEAIIERLLSKPSLESYREIKAAVPTSTLADLKQQLQQKSPDLLRQIYIEDGDIKAALALLPPMQSSDFLECYPHLLTAEAAEKNFPGDAIELYLRYATLHQSQQSISSCKEACRILARVKRLAPLERWHEVLRIHQAAWRDTTLFSLEASAAGLL